MKKKIAIGKSDFKTIIEQDYYYIDKSLLIKDVIDTSDEVLLIPRPRRFGKTLNMQMLKYFFMKSDDDFSSLFDGLAVTKHPDIMAHQGKYPVIHINLKGIKGSDWKTSYQLLIRIISDLYREHKYLADYLEEIDRNDFWNIIERKANEASLLNSLQDLAIWLKHYHQQPVIIIIDEYDTPILESQAKGYYEPMIDFMRSWLGEGLKLEKESGVLLKAVVTGIMRVAKESLFSGLNNFGVYPLHEISDFENKFGFTKPEVKQFLEYYGLDDHLNEVCEWYDGYNFGNSTIFNPWSTLNYVNKQPNGPAPYWLNTSSNDLVYETLQKPTRELRRDLEVLMAGNVIIRPVAEVATLRDTDYADDIWSFLLNSGYLTCSNPKTLFGEIKYELWIPNKEIKHIYSQSLLRWIQHKARFRQADELLHNLLKSDFCSFEYQLQQFVLSMLSFHDLGEDKPAEAVIQAFILGILASLTGDFQIRSNREEGKGRADIVMNPFDKNQCGFIIEIKSISSDDDLEKSLEEALQQIEEKQYSTGLEADGIKQIEKLAIVLQGKTVKVKAAE